MSSNCDSKTACLNLVDEDIPYEEEILRNAYSVKHWLRYLEHKTKGSSCGVNTIFERALKELPGSYKLWRYYLTTLKKSIRRCSTMDPKIEEVNKCFERALVFMHKMPSIWVDYCIFMSSQCKITRTRHIFDRALRALPITQHHRIWPLYLKFAKLSNVEEMAVKIYRRYLKLFPDDVEEYIDYLIIQGRLDEAAQQLAVLVDNENFVSKHGKSNHHLWNELCELMSKHPNKVHSLNIDAIIRGGLTRYTDQLSRLWISLANYYIRSGLFDRARDIYEEAIQTVTTVRDFTQVFDEYAQFEEVSLSKRIEGMNQCEHSRENDIEIELRLTRFEYLMDRRLLLLNSVLLRQNPHNVPEWLKRIKLYESKPHEIIKTFTEAVQTVQPKLATGKINTLWIEFAKFYEKNGQIVDARIVFEKATQVSYVKVDDLATVWCEWAEMEIRQKNFKFALKLMQTATVSPQKRVDYNDDTESVQVRLYKSIKIWSMYADIEESFGTFKTCKSVYDRIIDLKICTPQIIINYGLFLEEHGYFEMAFRAYEKGIALFKWPNVYDIWDAYLTKFYKRYGGIKLERARDLFEQCLENCPPDVAKYFYLLYAKLEEEHGLVRHAMAVYSRATTAVKPDEMFDMFNIFIKKAESVYGLPKTREIYVKAIEVLSEERMRDMCIRFAEMETKLGEIDRARTIYGHCSQVCDPRVTVEFWKTWKEFEVRHGNEDTMREMLRIKRAVQAAYNTQINMMTAQLSNSNVEQTFIDSMQLLDSQMSLNTKENKRNINIAFIRGKEHKFNPDEIDVSDIEVDGSNLDLETQKEGLENFHLEKQIVPENVFKAVQILSKKPTTSSAVN